MGLRGPDMTAQVECCVCSITFSVPSGWFKRRQEDGETFSCPNSHYQSFGISDLDLMRQERDRLKQQVAQRDDEVRAANRRAETERRTAIAYKGQATKLRKRAKGGVCACCNRTFENLARHMKSKHANYPGEQPVLKVVGDGS